MSPSTTAAQPWWRKSLLMNPNRACAKPGRTSAQGRRADLRGIRLVAPQLGLRLQGHERLVARIPTLFPIARLVVGEEQLSSRDSANLRRPRMGVSYATAPDLQRAQGPDSARARRFFDGAANSRNWRGECRGIYSAAARIAAASRSRTARCAAQLLRRTK